MTDWIQCGQCLLIYDPARFGPHPLHARLDPRESAYLTELAERARRGEKIGPNVPVPDAEKPARPAKAGRRAKGAGA